MNTRAEYSGLWERADIWEPAKAEICAAEGLDPSGFARETRSGGTHIVWLNAPLAVIKLHCPFFPDAPVEQAVLRFMANRLSVETPRLVCSGSVERWPYTVTTFVSGTPMRDVWPGLDHASRVRIARQLGAVIREWHDASVGHEIVATNGWREFLAQRVTTSVKLQQGSGMSARLISQIPAYLADQDPSIAEPHPPVLIHTDFKPDHILMSKAEGRWDVSGLIDVGDSMIGHREYDFIKATSSLSPSNRPVLRAFFQGYGESGVTLSREGSERMLGWALLHFDTPVWAYVRDGIGTSTATTLSQLSAEVWPLK